MQQLQSIVQPPSIPPFGPHAQDSVSAAWIFKGRPIGQLRNRDFYRMLHDFPILKRTPHTSLNSVTEPDGTTLWRVDIGLGKHVLPILNDHLFRLQHNGLNVRKKYSFTTNNICCPHNCLEVESAKHISGIAQSPKHRGLGF